MDVNRILAEVEQLSEYVKCAICFETLRDARMCPLCSGLFCRDCGLRCVQANGPTCPTCRILWTKTSNKPVKCRLATDVIEQVDKILSVGLSDYIPPPESSSTHLLSTFYSTLPARGIKWVNFNARDGSSLPANAFSAGLDQSGEHQYVCRVWFNRQLLPGKLNLAKQSAYVAYHKELEFGQCQVLCASNLSWFKIPGQDGVLPENIVEGGQSDFGKHYITRVKHEGLCYVCGMVLVDDFGAQICIYTYNGKVFESSDFEVLVSTIGTVQQELSCLGLCMRRLRLGFCRPSSRVRPIENPSVSVVYTNM